MTMTSVERTPGRTRRLLQRVRSAFSGLGGELERPRSARPEEQNAHVFIRDLDELKEAAKAGDKKRVKKLLKGGADPNHTSDTNLRTPLMIACIYGREDIAELLLRHGVRIDGRDIDGKTALSLASESGLIEIVEFLVDNGAYLDNQDRWGLTPLMAVALHWAIPHTAEYLLSKGADVARTDIYGKTAEDLVIKRLREYADNSCDGEPEAIGEALAGNYKEALELLEKTSPANGYDWGMCRWRRTNISAYIKTLEILHMYRPN